MRIKNLYLENPIFSYSLHIEDETFSLKMNEYDLLIGIYTNLALRYLSVAAAVGTGIYFLNVEIMTAAILFCLSFFLLYTFHKKNLLITKTVPIVIEYEPSKNILTIKRVWYGDSTLINVSRVQIHRLGPSGTFLVIEAENSIDYESIKLEMPLRNSNQAVVEFSDAMKNSGISVQNQVTL